MASVHQFRSIGLEIRHWERVVTASVARIYIYTIALLPNANG